MWMQRTLDYQIQSNILVPDPHEGLISNAAFSDKPVVITDSLFLLNQVYHLFLMFLEDYSKMDH